MVTKKWDFPWGCTTMRAPQYRRLPRSQPRPHNQDITYLFCCAALVAGSGTFPGTAPLTCARLNVQRSTQAQRFKQTEGIVPSPAIKTVSIPRCSCRSHLIGHELTLQMASGYKTVSLKRYVMYVAMRYA